jgi:hypothetical protein
LKDSPPELADALINYYQQEFPPKNLLAENKITAYCPEANCTYQRILDEEEEGFCPYHGTQLAKESDLPNPFSRPPKSLIIMTRLLLVAYSSWRTGV